MPATHLLLLRGVNVGGKHKLPMKDLASLVAEQGCSDVKTYIQSGNVIATVPPKLAGRLPGLVAKAIQARFGFEVPVVMRSLREIEQVVARNPFLADGKPPEALFVLFLRDLPDSARVSLLDPNRSPGDEFQVRGRDVYLWLATGAAETKLTNAYFDSKLATVSTSRNWRTVTTLLSMMKS